MRAGRASVIEGVVVASRGIGKSLGYPTANLDCEAPPGVDPGVYVARVFHHEEPHDAIFIVGAIPDVPPPSAEVHILNWSGDLYGDRLRVEVLEKLSDIEHMNSEDELIGKIERDLAAAREFFARRR